MFFRRKRGIDTKEKIELSPKIMEFYSNLPPEMVFGGVVLKKQYAPGELVPYYVGKLPPLPILEIIREHRERRYHSK